jgi:hypothetical protein
MALSEVMENSSNGSDRGGSSGGVSRGGSSHAAADARMVFNAEGGAVPFGPGPAGPGADGADAGTKSSVKIVSADHVVVRDGNVAYANHSVTPTAPSRGGVHPPLAGSGVSMPGYVSRSHSQSSHVSLTVVDEDAASGRSSSSENASPPLGITKDGDPFDPFEDVNRT